MFIHFETAAACFIALQIIVFGYSRHLWRHAAWSPDESVLSAAVAEWMDDSRATGSTVTEDADLSHLAGTPTMRQNMIEQNV